MVANRQIGVVFTFKWHAVGRGMVMKHGGEATTRRYGRRTQLSLIAKRQLDAVCRRECVEQYGAKWNIVVEKKAEHSREATTRLYVRSENKRSGAN